MSNLEKAKEEVSLILHKITQRDDDYFLDGKYCRWGRVERDLWAVLERHLTPLALDAANAAPAEPVQNSDIIPAGEVDTQPRQ